MEVKVNMHGIFIVPGRAPSMVMLVTPDAKRYFPVWVGPMDLTFLTIVFEKIKTPWPLTHELIIDVLLTADLIIDKVVIYDRKDIISFASIYFSGAHTFVLEARPGDAINLAMRSGCPVYVEDRLLVDLESRALEARKIQLPQTLPRQELAPFEEWPNPNSYVPWSEDYSELPFFVSNLEAVHFSLLPKA